MKSITFIGETVISLFNARVKLGHVLLAICGIYFCVAGVRAHVWQYRYPCYGQELSKSLRLDIAGIKASLNHEGCTFDSVRRIQNLHIMTESLPFQVAPQPWQQRASNQIWNSTARLDLNLEMAFIEATRRNSSETIRYLDQAQKEAESSHFQNAVSEVNLLCNSWWHRFVACSLLKA
jgi:hypothetical protein